MTFLELSQSIISRKTFLCVGLDADIEKLPEGIERSAEGLLAFNKAIIYATSPYCLAYKINTAFYEPLGQQGWWVMEETIKAIPKTHFIIADAKRGDIGNTSAMYAKAFLHTLDCDAITVSPYMGKDSVEPFYNYKNKWVIILGLTSNEGSLDFQQQELANGRMLYQQVMETASTWGNAVNTMFVVGATKPAQMLKLRAQLPYHFFLVPGVGAQGGNLADVFRSGKNDDIGLLVNSSRQIIYASLGADFAEAAENEAKKIQQEMALLLASH